MVSIHIRRYIPYWIGWLIVLKGMINLIFGILSFFGTFQASVINYFNMSMLFWSFTPVKSLTAILMGVAYIVVGRGLHQAKHLAWQMAIFWLCLNLLDSLVPRVVIVQVIYTLIMITVLWSARSFFNKPSKNPMRPQQMIALLSIVLVLAYGVIGCYLLRAQYQGINNLLDAVYYSLETYSTIGYGDIIPLTDNAKIFTCSMIILGVGTFVAAISILLGPAMEQRMKKVVNMVNKLSVPKNHVIVIGATILGLHTAKVLQAQGNSVIVLDSDSSQLKLAENLGFKTIAGETSREDVLEAANIKTANALICALNSDAQNLLSTMVAHTLRQKFKLKFKMISRIDEPQNIDYAMQNGADQVISPALILGDMVAKELSPHQPEQKS